MLDEQLLNIKIGILIGQDSNVLNMDAFDSIEDLRLYLNSRYNINIIKGMRLEHVITNLKRGIDAKRFENAGSCI